MFFLTADRSGDGGEKRPNLEQTASAVPATYMKTPWAEITPSRPWCRVSCFDRIGFVSVSTLIRNGERAQEIEF